MMSWERQITIKSKKELELMRTAGKINAEALQAVADLAQAGVTTAELNEAAETVLKKYGVYSPFYNYPGAYPYPASTTISINEELVHGIPGKRVLKEGDVVSVDCGTVYEGFVADSAITVPVGEISEIARKFLFLNFILIPLSLCSLFALPRKVECSSECQKLGNVHSYVKRRDGVVFEIPKPNSLDNSNLGSVSNNPTADSDGILNRGNSFLHNGKVSEWIAIGKFWII